MRAYGIQRYEVPHCRNKCCTTHKGITNAGGWKAKKRGKHKLKSRARQQGKRKCLPESEMIDKKAVLAESRWWRGWADESHDYFG